MRITYIGHATMLIELNGKWVLTDPNFDDTLARFLPRVRPPGIPLGDLPKLDAVLLTHAHADHLSFRTLDRLPRSIPLYAPAPVAAWLRRLGYAHAEAIDPGGRTVIGGVKLHAAAATHNGGRYALDRWRSAANMYLLDDGVEACFFAGDTALTSDSHHLVEQVVGNSGRQLDVALLPIGHAPWWKPAYRRGHLTWQDALSLFERLSARCFIPYHWGTFQHVTSRPFDAVNQLRAMLPSYARRQDVRILESGETLEYVRARG